MVNFVKVPFANTGDKNTIPEATQVDGTVSFEEGYGPDYSLDPLDINAKDVERDKQNYLFNLVTAMLKDWQTQGYPEFITSADNGGTPYLYPIKSFVRFDDGAGYDIYYSLVNANNAAPTDQTKWARLKFGDLPPGSWVGYEGSVLPSGWVWRNGLTIGNASSGGTNRANADTLPLFTLYWNEYPNSILPIQDSTGAASTRGASALADFNANKRLPTVDMRGRGAFGKDDMGGASAANRITSAESGISGNQNGGFGGAQTVAIDTTQIPSHGHSFSATTSSDGLHSHTYTIGNTAGATSTQIAASTPGHVDGAAATITSSNSGLHSHTVSGTTGNAGGGLAHQNMPPTIIGNFIVKL